MSKKYISKGDLGDRGKCVWTHKENRWKTSCNQSVSYYVGKFYAKNFQRVFGVLGI